MDSSWGQTSELQKKWVQSELVEVCQDNEFFHLLRRESDQKRKGEKIGRMGTQSDADTRHENKRLLFVGFLAVLVVL